MFSVNSVVITAYKAIKLIVIYKFRGEGIVHESVAYTLLSRGITIISIFLLLTWQEERFERPWTGRKEPKEKGSRVLFCCVPMDENGIT